MDKKNKSDLQYNYTNIYFLYFFINIIIALQLSVMRIMPDEFNTIGAPALLAGYDWSNAVSGYKNYYGYGQAIFYTPLIYFINDGVLLYRSMIIMNSFFISFIPVIVFYITKNFFEIKENKIQALITFAVSLLPCYLTLSTFTMNETFVMLLLWVVILFLCRCFLNSESNKSNVFDSIGLGIALIYGYTVHGRFLAIIVTVLILVILFKFIQKRNLIANIPFIIAIVATYILDKILKSYFLKNVWLVNDSSELRNTFSETLLRIIEVIDLEYIFIWLRGFNGYIFYLVISSMGLVILGANFLIKLLKDKKEVKNENSRLIFMGLFSYITIICALGIAVLFFSTEFESNDYYYIYGRYTEYVLGPIILFVLIYLIKDKASKKELVLSFCIMILSSGLTVILERNRLVTAVIPSLNAYTLISFSKNLIITGNILNLISAILVGLILNALLCFIIFKNNNKYMYIFIIVVFLNSYFRIGYSQIIAESDRIFKMVELSYNFFDNEDFFINNEYKRVYLYDNHPVNHQLFMKNYLLYPRTNENTEIKENSFIVSNKKFKLNCDYDKLYILDEEVQNGINSEVILVYGDELYNELLSQGYQFKTTFYEMGNKIKFDSNSKAYCYELLDGWSIQEQFGVWSNNKTSSLNIILDSVPEEEVELLMELSAFNSDKELKMYINDVYIQDLTVSCIESNLYSVKIPKNTITSTTLNIKFEYISELQSPQELGMGNDDRTLGIGLISMQLKVKQTYKVGDTINFGEITYFSEIIGEGWSDQENWGVWSVDNNSTLNVLFKDEIGRDLNLELSLSAFNNAKTIDVYVNKTFVDEIKVSQDELNQYSVNVPKDLITDKEIMIEFNCKEELLSPSELGISADERKLGIGLGSLKFSEK